MPELRVTVWVQKKHDRPHLVLEWHDPENGRRHSRTAGTADPDEAEQKRKDLEYELAHGLVREPGKMTWENFRLIYMEEKLDGAREATRLKAEGVFDSFEKFANPKTIGKITERVLSRYSVRLRERPCSPATIHGHLAYLRAALRWAADQKLIQAAPKIAMPKLSKKKTIRKIVAEQFERLLEKAPSDLWRAYMATAWYTGMRRNEMLDLSWDDKDLPTFDFRDNKVRIPAAYNKSDEDQWIPLHPELKEIVEALPGDRKGKIFPFHGVPREVSRKFTKLARSAGLKITLHDLRRSFGSRYAAVVPAAVLQRLMRHADIKTTLTYYTDVDDALDEAILKA